MDVAQSKNANLVDTRTVLHYKLIGKRDFGHPK